MTFLLYTFLSISGGKMSIGGMYKGFWKHQYRFEKVGFWYNLHINKLASPRSWHAPSAEKGAAATRLTTNAKYEGSVGSGFAHCSVPLILRWGNDKQGNSEQTANAGAKLKKIFNFGSDSMKYIERPEYMQRLLDLMEPRISRSLPECAAAASLNWWKLISAESARFSQMPILSLWISLTWNMKD